MRTKVCFTIDTEFSIGGAFGDPSLLPVAEPLVWCKVAGRSEGLGFMLETFRHYGVRSTFFVETSHCYHFGTERMGAIAQHIHAEGHEVQMHVHPCWQLFQHADWRERAKLKRRRDDFLGLSVEESLGLIRHGLDTFATWNLPRPLAFRSGNLQHDDNLYQALAQAGIPYSSNIAVAICDSGEARYRLYSGRHELHGVSEFPVLSFSDWKLGNKQHMKSMTIAGTSFEESVSMLEKARAAGIETVVVLTHPFEYVHKDDVTFQHTRRHSLTQRRLALLCRYLQDNQDRFDACGLVEAAQSAGPGGDNVLLQGSLLQSIPRMMAQVTHDGVGQWLLARTRDKRKAA